MVAVIGVDGIAVAIGDHDVAGRPGRLVVAPSGALTLSLSLALALALSLPLAGRVVVAFAVHALVRAAAAAGLVVLLCQRGLGEGSDDEGDESEREFQDGPPAEPINGRYNCGTAGTGVCDNDRRPQKFRRQTIGE